MIFPAQSQHPAKLVGRDQRTNLALLKVKADKADALCHLGQQRRREVGDWVVVVGNLFGLGGTVAAGIISALGGNINEGPSDDLLQIDAPFKRGNSSGPTFDLARRVVGHQHRGLFALGRLCRDRLRYPAQPGQICGR